MLRSLKDMLIDNEQKRWESSLNLFLMYFKFYKDNLDSADRNAQNLFTLVDRFPVLKKDLPDELKIKYDNRVDTVI